MSHRLGWHTTLALLVVVLCTSCWSPAPVPQSATPPAPTPNTIVQPTPPPPKPAPSPQPQPQPQPKVETYEVNVTDAHPVPLPFNDTLADDQLADKKPVFDPDMIDARPLDGWQLNVSSAVLKLDVP